MDIQNLSSSLAQSRVADAVGSALLKKSLSEMGDAGAALAQLFVYWVVVGFGMAFKPNLHKVSFT